jgi:hypothetical protein
MSTLVGWLVGWFGLVWFGLVWVWVWFLSHFTSAQLRCRLGLISLLFISWSVNLSTEFFGNSYFPLTFTFIHLAKTRFLPPFDFSSYFEILLQKVALINEAVGEIGSLMLKKGNS